MAAREAPPIIMNLASSLTVGSRVLKRGMEVDEVESGALVSRSTYYGYHYYY